MARTTTDVLDGYAMNLLSGEEQVVDNGMPVFNGSGEPKMKPVWRFRFAWASADGTTHEVISPALNDEGRKQLIEKLSHGIVPASALPQDIIL